MKSMNFSPAQAKLKVVMENPQISCACVQMPNMKFCRENIAAALDRKDSAAAAQLANLVATVYIAETKDINRRNLEQTQAEFDTQVERRGQDLGERLAEATRAEAA